MAHVVLRRDRAVGQHVGVAVSEHAPHTAQIEPAVAVPFDPACPYVTGIGVANVRAEPIGTVISFAWDMPW